MFWLKMLVLVPTNMAEDVSSKDIQWFLVYNSTSIPSTSEWDSQAINIMWKEHDMFWRNVSNYLTTLQMLSDVCECSPNYIHFGSLWSYKWALQDIHEAPGLQLIERTLLFKLTAKRTKGHVEVSEFQLPGASFFLFSLFLTVMWYQHWDKSSAAQTDFVTDSTQCTP